MNETPQGAHTDCAECGAAAPAGDAALASRRRFLGWLSLAAGAVAGAVAAVPFLGTLLSPVRRELPGPWRAVGSVDEFPVGATILVRFLDPEPLPWAGFAARSAAYLRREEDGRFVAFSPYCTHVGCPVTWSAGAHKFFCPCHGGTFHADGRVAAGPPPRALERMLVRVRDGRVELQPIGAPRTG